MGLIFLSILIPYVFGLEHLVHLRSVLLLKDNGFRVIVISVGFMLVVMSLVLCGPCNISLTESPLGSLVGQV